MSLADKCIVVGCFVCGDYDKLLMETGKFSDNIRVTENGLVSGTKPFIFLPDREQLHQTMPMEFRKSFGLKVASIIDCFEIFIESPSNLKARAQTWSNYKHNTVKYLIGITPQGCVSFISSGWGGRASDKCITEHCGFLDKRVQMYTLVYSRETLLLVHKPHFASVVYAR